MSNEVENLVKAKLKHRSGKIEEAIKIYQKLIVKEWESPEVFFRLGTAFLQKKYYERAIDYLKQAINLNNNEPNYYNNIGIAYSKLKLCRNAVENYEIAINLNKNFLDAIINLGIEYRKLNKLDLSRVCFEKANILSPNNYLVYNNLGNLFKDFADLDSAISFYNKAIKIKKDNTDAYNNKAEIFLLQKKFGDAINNFKKVLDYNKNFDFTFGKYVHSKMHICDWENYDENILKLINEINNGNRVIEPFVLLSLTDSLKLQLKNANIYKNVKFSKQNSYSNLVKKNPAKKIKIGYFGAEFYNHPVLQLTKDIFKNHNKLKFEIYGFYHGRIKDKLHYEIQKFFKKFFDISKKTDDEVLDICHKVGLDIAVNLTGYTADSRNEIYQKRIAPVQISFVGYSGSMGVDFIDYIIADKCLIPKEKFKYYTEKVIYMPDSFFPNQSKIKISSKNFTKKNLNLPQNNFIFGSFNNSYKITPKIFRTWMKILNRTSNSVLWLLNNNDKATENLIKTSESYNVDPKRLIFAEKLPYDEHLKRFDKMDLFLDTFPYNAHTTASEAIRREVPIITMMGESFASRVCGSLLNSIGMKDLITMDLIAYENLAVKIANSKKIYNELKKKIKSANSKKLFNSKYYTKNLEELFIKILN